ncbi:hypothetical protein, partial [Vibrio parahaemolyticus]|uniref:hypothetical protein n=1 Tax=Vibrio parahaemolyticus TaxID=670 RepID=UPI003C1300E0
KLDGICIKSQVGRAPDSQHYSKASLFLARLLNFKSQSGKLTGQVYPSSRRYFGDSCGAIQKPISCIADFGDDVVVTRKRLVG